MPLGLRQDVQPEASFVGFGIIHEEFLDVGSESSEHAHQVCDVCFEL